MSNFNSFYLLLSNKLMAIISLLLKLVKGDYMWINYYGVITKRGDTFNSTKAFSNIIGTEIGNVEISNSLTCKIKQYAKSRGLAFKDIYIVRDTTVYKRKTRKGKWKYSHRVITGKTINENSEITCSRLHAAVISNSKKFYFRF